MTALVPIGRVPIPSVPTLLECAAHRFEQKDFLTCCKFAEVRRALDSLACPLLGPTQCVRELITHRVAQHPPFPVSSSILASIRPQGDSRVLMQKMSRDRLRVFAKTQADTDRATWDDETALAATLAAELAAGAKEHGGDKQKAWDENWEAVYELADKIMDNTVASFMAYKGK